MYLFAFCSVISLGLSELKEVNSVAQITTLNGEICICFLNPARVTAGEGNSIPLQYSCLENPMDGGAWWAAVYGVTKSRTRLK